MDSSMILVLSIFIGSFLIFLFSGWLIAFSLAAATILAYIFIAGGGAIGNFAVLGYNAMFNYNLIALPIFIFMGGVLIEGGVGKRLYDAVLPIAERVPGGLIHTNIGANVILGACCGSTIAATSCISTVAIPELNKRGYAKEICYGSLASAGCLACLIPPSVGMIMFTSITTVSLGELFIAGIIPGLLLAFSFSVITAIWVKIRPKVAPPPPKRLMPLGKAVLFGLGHLWPVLILIIVVLGAIYLGIGTPTEAGCYGILGALILGYRQFNWKKLKASLFVSTRISVSLLFIIAMASIYGFALNALGLRSWVLGLLAGLPGGPSTQMYIVWFVLLVLGMFLDSAAVIVITTPLLLPFAVSLGFDPIWFGVWLMLAVQLGNITPPVGVTLYAVQAISGDPLDIIAKGCFPYWTSFFMTMIPITFFPFIVTWLPRTAGYI